MVFNVNQGCTTVNCTKGLDKYFKTFQTRTFKTRQDQKSQALKEFGEREGGRKTEIFSQVDWKKAKK